MTALEFDPGGIASPPDPKDHSVPLDEAIVVPRRWIIGPNTKSSMAPVTNQGKLPECGGYTGIDVMRYHGKVAGDGVLNLDPHWLYRRAQTRDGIPLPHRGTTARGVLQTLRLEGVPEIAKPGSAARGSAARNMIGSYGRLPFTAGAITTALVQYEGPIVIGMAWPASFFHPVRGLAPQPSGERYGHLLELIGKDDNVAGGSALLQNHWRETWGQGGRIWIPWRWLLPLIHDAWKVLDAGVSVKP